MALGATLGLELIIRGSTSGVFRRGAIVLPSMPSLMLAGAGEGKSFDFSLGLVLFFCLPSTGFRFNSSSSVSSRMSMTGCILDLRCRVFARSAMVGTGSAGSWKPAK